MAKRITLAIGVTFLLLGVLGFVPAAIMHDSAGMSLLFGIFLVDPMQNVVHIASGVVAILAGSSHRYSRWYLQIAGIIYGLMAVAGFMQGQTVVGLFGTNMATNLLHVMFAVLLLWAGFGLSDGPKELRMSKPKPPGQTAM